MIQYETSFWLLAISAGVKSLLLSESGKKCQFLSQALGKTAVSILGPTIIAAGSLHHLFMGVKSDDRM
jgi:hypothetical protein